MVQIRIDTEENECRKDVFEALGAFIVEYILDETCAAYKAGYEKGHKDGMTEAVTTITERQHEHDWEPVSTEGTSLAMVKCTICGATEYRL